MSRVETFIRAREMLVGYRDECHPGCWVSCTITEITSETIHDDIFIQMHDDALGINTLAKIEDDKVEDAIARLATDYAGKRAAKIAALKKAVSLETKPNDPASVPAEEGERE